MRFVKVHDTYTLTANDEPLMEANRGADGVILIVRDPRDVAASLANHNRSSIDEAIAFMNNPRAMFCANPQRQHIQLRQRLLNWSGHVRSWLEQTDIPVHLIRYEDMQANIEQVFRRALAFAGRIASDEQIQRAVTFANFDELQRQESQTGFGEAPRSLGGPFFRRGQSGSWRDELTPEQVDTIETAHAVMMQRLGYQLSRARTGTLTQAGEAA